MPTINEQKLKEKSLNYTMNAWDAYLYDYKGVYFAKADALSESSVALATEMVDKKGGSSNLTLFSIPSSKELTATLTVLDFDAKRLALQTGEKFNLGKFVVKGRTDSCEVVTETNTKKITLSEVPYGKSITIESGDGGITVPLPTVPTKEVDVTAFIGTADTCVNVIYAAEVESEQLDLAGDTPPAVIQLILKKKVWNSASNTHVKTITMDIPKFQLDGNLTFAGTLGDSDTMGLSGKAKASKSSTCGSTVQTLGSINIENVDDSTLYDATEISTVKAIELKVSEIDNITVMGVKGSESVYNPFDITEKCTYVSDDETKVTVDAVGKVTGVAKTTTPAKITVGFNGLTAEIEVNVLAAP